MGPHDSPRWCMFCQVWGDHHTERCPVEPDRDRKIAEAKAKTDAAAKRIHDAYLAPAKAQERQR